MCHMCTYAYTGMYVRTYIGTCVHMSVHLNNLKLQMIELFSNNTEMCDGPTVNVFATLEEYETGIEMLKERLKEHVRSAFQEISIACYHGVFDVWGSVLNVSKSEFLTFTKNKTEEWCDKKSYLFETCFDSVLHVMFTRDKAIEIKTLELFIDNFFCKCHIFDEILDN